MKKYSVYIGFLILFLGLYFYLDYMSNPNKILGQFTTTLDGRSCEQVKNIINIIKRLDNIKIDKGEVFSFNNHIGICRQEKGFQYAPMIVDGRVEDSLGGGICQVSSTLYNAILLSGVEIVERHAHSYKVNSVPPGLDATVSYGKADLSFKNNYSFPIYIKTKYSKNRILVKIAAQEKLPYKIEILRLVKKTIVPPGACGGQNGAVVEVKRQFYRGNKLEKEEILSLDTYKFICL